MALAVRLLLNAKDKPDGLQLALRHAAPGSFFARAEVRYLIFGWPAEHAERLA
jgi:hypothetical protein